MTELDHWTRELDSFQRHLSLAAEHDYRSWQPTKWQSLESVRDRLLSICWGGRAGPTASALELGCAHPTVFCGYSDTTTLHAAIQRETGLVTFYGPSVLMELGDHPAPFTETVMGFRRATGEGIVGEVPALPTVVVEGTDWDAPHRRRQVPAPQPRLVRAGVGRGPLAGGCLPRVTTLVGTRWQIPTTRRILLLETPQAPFAPDQALDHLWHLRHAGLLDDLAGLVVGWPAALDQVDDLETALGLAIPSRSSYPVLFGRPFGHTSPFLTLPLGVEAVLEGDDFRVIGHATTSGP